MLRKWKGQSLVLSEIDNIWCGDFLRNERKKWPELFLYSKRDFYLPWQYMEETIDRRQKAGREVLARCFEKSRHVEHLRGNKSEYVTAVHDFLEMAYFKTLSVEQEDVQIQPRQDMSKLEDEEAVEDRDRRATMA